MRARCHGPRDPPVGRDREPACEPHDSTGEPGAGNRPAGFGERGEETCPWESDCGPAAKAPDEPPNPYRLRASSRLYYKPCDDPCHQLVHLIEAGEAQTRKGQKSVGIAVTGPCGSPITPVIEPIRPVYAAVIQRRQAVDQNPECQLEQVPFDLLR